MRHSKFFGLAAMNKADSCPFLAARGGLKSAFQAERIWWGRSATLCCFGAVRLNREGEDLAVAGTKLNRHVF